MSAPPLRRRAHPGWPPFIPLNPAWSRRIPHPANLSPASGCVLRRDALRLLLTGCRRNEILTLRWEDVDLNAGELNLADSKTGARSVPLSPAAVKMLAELPRVEGNQWLIPGRKPGTHMLDPSDAWQTVRKRAGLEDVRLHDLRHSFASRALALGESLPVIGKHLGHTQVETTARYAHLARDSVRESAARIAASIRADLVGARVNSGCV